MKTTPLTLAMLFVINFTILQGQSMSIGMIPQYAAFQSFTDADQRLDYISIGYGIEYHMKEHFTIGLSEQHLFIAEPLSTSRTPSQINVHNVYVRKFFNSWNKGLMISNGLHIISFTTSRIDIGDELRVGYGFSMGLAYAVALGDRIALIPGYNFQWSQLLSGEPAINNHAFGVSLNYQLVKACK